MRILAVVYKKPPWESDIILQRILWMLCGPEGDTHLPKIRWGLRSRTCSPPRLKPNMDYPANCRILVLSSSPDLSSNLIHREFAFECVGSPLTQRPPRVGIIKTETMSDGPFTEWVISNKYYTAPVHFHWPTWTGTASNFESGTPAVLYVFSGKDVSIVLWILCLYRVYLNLM